MIYLSQLMLNPRSPQVQAELRDPYQMHRTLSRAFGAEFEAARVLFRVEDDKGALHVLVQSQRAPDWAYLPLGRYLAAPPRLKPFEPQFQTGQVLAFRLRANPTMRKKEGDARDGRRVGLYREPERLAWLERKAADGGFRVLTSLVRDEGRSQSKVRADGTRASLVQVRCGAAAFSAARFDGLLTVTDAAAFQDALENGIGTGKGFGFGLLSVARA